VWQARGPTLSPQRSDPLPDPAVLKELLARGDAFRALDPEAIALLVDGMAPRALAAGEALCRQGDPGDCMYIVQSGELRATRRLETGEEVEIAVLRPGETACVTSLLERTPRPATLTAVRASVVWALTGDALLAALQARPASAEALLAAVSRALRRETERLASVRPTRRDPRLAVAVVDSKPYTQEAFEERNAGRYALSFFEPKLSLSTAPMVGGHPVVCAFVNDRLDAPVIEVLAEQGVRMVALRCAGYNNVDLETCERSGISVARVPAYSPHAVAEHAVALMLALNRHIHRADARIREGNFSLNGLVGFDMHGKTVGVVGAGRIGQCLVDILVGFGCRSLVYDVAPRGDARELVEYVALERIWRESDIISLHAPLLPATRHMVNRESIALMKPGVMLINTSRGGLIDTQALIEALVAGHVGSAGLDVYEEETEYFFEAYSTAVIADDTLARLMTLHNVMITSHMGFLTREALVNIADTTFANIAEFESGKRGSELTNCVVAQR